MPTVSVVIPSMNEEGTIGACIKKALAAFEKMEIDGEIIVSDSSTDKTPDIARSLGAKVVTPSIIGYGNAYLEGLSATEGEYIVIADADDTYDLLEIPKFLAPLMNDEADFVMGTRLKGEIKKGAMPWLHQYVGNPLLTKILNLLFKTSISDTHCGMRAFTKGAIGQMNLKSGGMEFASEMVIEAARKELRIKEVPITYHPRDSPSKLNSFSDGWRHLRFMMLYNPTPFLFLPGIVFFVFGLLLTLTLMLRGDGVTTRLHSLIFGGILTIIGYQTIVTGLYMKVYGVVHGITEVKGFIRKFLDYHSLEVGLFIGITLFIIGLTMGLKVLLTWVYSGFGELVEVENAVLSMVTAAIGIQTIFLTLFISVLLLGKDVNSER